MFVYWNNSSLNPYWNSHLEQNWTIHEYSSLFMFLEVWESRASLIENYNRMQFFQLGFLFNKFGFYSANYGVIFMKKWVY